MVFLHAPVLSDVEVLLRATPAVKLVHFAGIHYYTVATIAALIGQSQDKPNYWLYSYQVGAFKSVRDKWVNWDMTGVCHQVPPHDLVEPRVNFSAIL